MRALLSSFAASLSVVLSLTAPVSLAQAGPTHSEVQTIKVTTQDQPGMLNTFCLDAKGNILAACGGSKTRVVVDAAGRRAQTTQGQNQIRVLSPEGKAIAEWNVPFAPQAIQHGPDGRIYVGGEGRLAVLDAGGKQLAETTVVDKAGARVTGIAVTSRDVFVAASSQKGTGYEIWRLGLDLKAPQVVLSGQRGCCGQCDIQARGDDLLVADNTKHQVARYDRDGKSLQRFGKSSREGGEGFGGCCNPMNLRVGSKGEIYTAESEGLIKCFDQDGKLLASVGNVKLSGSCTHVAVDVSADGERVYLLDTEKVAIVVLGRNGK